MKKKLLCVAAFASLSFYMAMANASQHSWPAESHNISAAFGPRIQGGAYDWHRGIDIFGPQESRIFAMADGVAQIYPDGSEQFPSSGNVVVITHDDIVGPDGGPVYSFYAHLNSFNIEDGEAVVRGQDIGGMGNTGSTEFVHLHFEVREDTRRSLQSQINAGLCPNVSECKDPHVNPLKYIGQDDLTPPQIEVISESPDPLVVRFTTTASELDLNRFEVKTSGLGSLVIDFNSRVGFDASSAANLDLDPTPSGIDVNPPSFTSQSFLDGDDFIIEIDFGDVGIHHSVMAADTFGNSTSIRNIDDDFLLSIIPILVRKKAGNVQ